MKRVMLTVFVGTFFAAALAPTAAFAGATSCNDDPGVYYTQSSTFLGRDSLTTGAVERTAFLDNNPGWLAITGDWNNSGTDGLGIFNIASGTFFLANSFPDQPASPIAAEYSFFMTVSGVDWWPIAGNWNGADGDGVGIVNKTTGTMFLVNDVVSGGLSGAFLASDYGFFLTTPMDDWLPIAGNWNGVGGDGVGIYNTINGAQFLANDAAQSLPAAFVPSDYGLFMSPDGGDYYPVTGDWDGSGQDGPGIWNKSAGTFFLADNGTGAGGGLLPADYLFFLEGGQGPLSGADQRPLSGCWVANE